MSRAPVRGAVTKGKGRIVRPRLKRGSRGKEVPSDYLRLVRQFPLRPLRGDKDYDAAAALLDILVGRAHLTNGQQDYLDALTTFVEAYDRKHYPMTDPPPPLETLKAQPPLPGPRLAAGNGVPLAGAEGDVRDRRQPLPEGEGRVTLSVFGGFI
jgi:HTH-type transcriptional regulator/antitoxin HigA